MCCKLSSSEPEILHLCLYCEQVQESFECILQKPQKVTSFNMSLMSMVQFTSTIPYLSGSATHTQYIWHQTKILVSLLIPPGSQSLTRATATSSSL